VAKTTSKELQRIALIAGPVRIDDREGHHDYLATCTLMADLLRRVPGIDPLVIDNGWPQDDRILTHCAGLVFYDGGGGKQQFLATPERVGRLQQIIDAGAGLTIIHKSIAFPDAMTAQSVAWLGGTYVPGVSRRGHWRSRHHDLGKHPITSALEGWKMDDGWLNNIQFDEAARQNITPILWSGKRYKGSSAGGDEDIVSWAYERIGGGRSFCFTGLDAHSDWLLPDLRRLLLNGVLWSVGQEVPVTGSWCEMGSKTIDSYLSPRKSTMLAPIKGLWKVAGRKLGLGHNW